MAIAAATVVAKSHLALARVLARSFRDHHQGVPFFVLLTDEVEGCFEPTAEPFELVFLEDLDVPEAEGLRFRYAKQPLSYACTPWLLLHLLARGFSRVLFLKQESLVLAPMRDALARLERCSALLTPHLVAPLSGAEGAERERIILLSGVYNIGFVGVSDRPAARELLLWWGERTLFGCRHAVDRGMHYEQRWLDLAPCYFDGVELLRDPSYNVAHWNLRERRVELHGGEVHVNGSRCRLFRFSGFDPQVPDRPTRYFERPRMDEIGDAAAVFGLYRRRLEDEGHGVASRWPYAFNHFDNGVPVPDLAREIHADLEARGVAFEHPFATGAGSYYQWLQSRARPDAPGVSRFWWEVHRRRPDIARIFPEPLARDREAFLAWVAATGLQELALSAEHWAPRRG